MKQEVIIALDFPGRVEAMEFLEGFREETPYVKVGMELFYSAGPGLVRELKEKGHGVFVDLKLHDIPHTVKKAMKVLAGLGADMCNVHACGGRKMMEGAMEGLLEGTPGGQPVPTLLAVTQLTSTDSEMLSRELLIPRPMKDVVISYAALAKEAGLSGVVASPLEVEALKETLGTGFLAVTPGIRPDTKDGSNRQDQVRTKNPYEAGKMGSDFIVVGRPITKAQDPLQAYLDIRREFEEGIAMKNQGGM